MTLNYGLTHKDDKKKILAKDHWGRTILFTEKSEAEQYISHNKEWEIKETKMKVPKNKGDIHNIAECYFRNNT